MRRGEDLRGGGGGRSNKEEVVKSLIASAIGPCTGIRCAAGDEALALDLRGWWFKRREKKSSDWGRREPQLTGERQLSSWHPHSTVSGNPCCWEAVMTRSAITAAALLYACFMSVCAIETNNASSLVGVWQLSTDKPPNPTSEQELRTEMRLNRDDLFHREPDPSTLGLIEAVCGLRQAQLLFVCDQGHSVWRQSCWKSICHLASPCWLVGYTSEYQSWLVSADLFLKVVTEGWNRFTLLFFAFHFSVLMWYSLRFTDKIIHCI